MSSLAKVRMCSDVLSFYLASLCYPGPHFTVRHPVSLGSSQLTVAQFLMISTVWGSGSHAL